ncbi:ATP-binding protein [Tsuneonella sp. HG249]
MAGDQAEVGRVVGTDGTKALCLVDIARLAEIRAGSADEADNTSVGAIVRVAVQGRAVFCGLVELARIEGDAGHALAELEYIGEGVHDAAGALAGFRRGVSAFPQPGDTAHFATEPELAVIFAPPDAPHIQFGTVYPTRGVRAPVLFDQLLSRHFAIVGSSGAGKSTTVSLLLDRIVEQAGHGHVVIFDPHGEYAHAFGDRAQVWDVGNLVLPYWAMNLDEHCEAFIASGDERTVDANIMAKVLLRARQRNIHAEAPGRITADTPVSYQYKDLTDALEDEAGRLEKLADASRYTHLRLTIEQFFHDRRYGFIFNPEHAGASLEQLLGDVLRIPNNGKPISILDLAGVPTEIVNVVVATLTRLILDYAIWSPRDTRAPILLVCEEAHRYLPAHESEATRSVRRQLERVAREGRKYGVCLGLVSQRPSELSDTALSQCGTLISLRLNNQADQDHLVAALTEGARSLAGAVGSLRNRECIISGEGVPVPMRVEVDFLEAGKRPLSDDPSFSTSWSHDVADRRLLHETIRRWQVER